jgi:hypothetical protein
MLGSPVELCQETTRQETTRQETTRQETTRQKTTRPEDLVASAAIRCDAYMDASS